MRSLVINFSIRRTMLIFSSGLLLSCQSVFVSEQGEPSLRTEPRSQDQSTEPRVLVRAPQLEQCTLPRYRKVYQENARNLEEFILDAIKRDGRLSEDARVLLEYSFQSFFVGVSVDCPDNAYWYNGFSLTLLPGWTYTTILMKIQERDLQVSTKAVKLNVFHWVTSRPPPFSFIIGSYDDWPQPVERRFDPVHTDLLVKMLYSGIDELYPERNQHKVTL